MKNTEFNEELIAYIFNPKRLMRLSIQYDISFYNLIEIY
jgi:hypothetical protein